MSLRFPSSLATQLALIMALAVLAAAAVQLVVLLLERNRIGLIEVSGPAVTRFADISSEALNLDLVELRDDQRRSLRRRGGRIGFSSENVVIERGLPRQPQIERRLRRALDDLGHADVTVMAATRTIDESELRRFEFGPFGNRDRPPERNRKFREIVLVSELAPGRWMSGTFLSPAPPNDEFGRLFLGVLVAVGCVLGAAIWMSSRLVRPLGDLATAAGRLGSSAKPQALDVRGPKEIRRTLSAFNNMSARVSDLLREKDAMLGALGHDLRTPLASLRIRVEGMEPASERQKAIETIEETARLLESILDFARAGRGSEAFASVHLADLVTQIVEDYRVQGANVSAGVLDSAIAVQTNADLVRRLLRNLIDNAGRHGSVVTVGVARIGDDVSITVNDDGPGIPEAELERVREPFYRLDGSRSRTSGGAGLGLALADTIATGLGGSLELSNLEPHGLSARVVLPVQREAREGDR